jgi:hypothetical protein
MLKSELRDRPEPEKQILFKVLVGVHEHKYLIYDDGTTEGFKEGAIVFNYYDGVLSREIERCIHARTMFAQKV